MAMHLSQLSAAAVFDKERQVLYVGNLGDSRCVVGSKFPQCLNELSWSNNPLRWPGVCSDSGIMEAVDMSKDHSATTDSERLRVTLLLMNGTVSPTFGSSICNRIGVFRSVRSMPRILM